MNIVGITGRISSDRLVVDKVFNAHGDVVAKVINFKLIYIQRVKGEDKPHKLNCACWGNNAEKIEQLFKDGDKINITGAIHQDKSNITGMAYILVQDFDVVKDS